MASQPTKKVSVEVTLLLEDVERFIAERQSEGWTREDFARRLGEMLGMEDVTEQEIRQ